MSFFSVFVALILEQARAVPLGHPVHGFFLSWVEWVRRHFDAGQPHHAKWAWVLAVLLPAITSAGVFWALSSVAVVLAWVWVVAVLYLTMGFRQFSHHFTEIRDALATGDEDAARTELARWLSIPTHRLTRQQIVALTMQNGVLAAHRHVLGVIVCFALFAAVGLGPAGAVLYRLAQLVGQRWVMPTAQGWVSVPVASMAERAWAVVDWLPVRMSALCFAVVGHFEEALARWRAPMDSTLPNNDAVLLAVASGALAVEWRDLGHTEAGDADPMTTPTELKVAHLGSTVGLLWRSVVLWLLVLALLTMAAW
jgi:adenosylcobinamide-phosphate synthase